MKKWSHDTLTEYWASESKHEDYVDGHGRSGTIVDLVAEAWPDKSISILEPGCNIGRNLHFLMEAGYNNLSGIDVSPRVFPFMQRTFPDVAETAVFYEGTIEDYIVEFEDGQFDVIVTMAVLEHIHPDSEWIFEHLARVARLGIVTVEDERHISSPRIWNRNYKAVFEGLGLEQDFEKNCHKYPGLSPKAFDGVGKRFWARRFRKHD